MRWIFLPLLLSPFLPACAQPPAPLFLPAPGSPLAIEGNPYAAAASDFNHDGRADLLVLLSDPPALRILAGDGSGRFGTAASASLALPFAPGEIVLADLNGDGNLDVAGATHESYSVLVLLGDGQGRLAPAPGSPFAAKQGNQPHGHGLLAGDVNGDRRVDLLAIHSNPDDDLSVLLNDGQARFAPAPGSPFPLGRAPYPSALADLDGDGHLDVASPSTGSDPPSLTIVRGDGRGAFQPAPGPLELQMKRPFFVGAGDLEGDRDLDLLVTHDEMEKLSLLLNDGKGHFRESPASPFSLGGRAWEAALSDLDGDGRRDLVTAGGGHVRAFLAGAEHGRFDAAPGSPYPVPNGSWRLGLADLNGDGRQDLITCGVEDRRIALLLHR